VSEANVVEPQPRDGAVELVYQEICRSHEAITQFRAKLLALLPLASGAGVFLLLQQGSSFNYLGAIGLFGAAITLGLFLYELLGMQTCHRLRDQAVWFEGRLRIPQMRASSAVDQRKGWEDLSAPLGQHGSSIQPSF
jgi:hypothetical protein